MKKHFFHTTLVLASILVLSACQSPISQNNTLHYNILEFQEQARVNVPNDTMHIVFAIQEQHANRQQASQAVNRKLANLQNKLKQFKQLKIELGNRNVYPQYGRNNQISHWEDNVELRVQSTDFDAMSQIIADSQSDAMLRGVSFSVSPEKRTQAIEQASDQALNAIRQRAAFLSKKMGFSGYQIVKVELNDSFEQNQPHQRKMAYGNAAMLTQAAAPEMMVSADQAGEENISQNVRVSVQMQ